MSNELNTANVDELMNWCDQVDTLLDAFENQETMKLTIGEIIVNVSGTSCVQFIKILEQRQAQIRGILNKVEEQLSAVIK